MSRSCSQCANNGHNSRTCEISAGCGGGGGFGGGAASPSGGGGENGIMLFGVRMTPAVNEVSSMRKSVSMYNLSQYDQHQDLNGDDHHHDLNGDVAAGYESDDVVHASGRSRERKRGVPWTEEEHKAFLWGLQKVGKGDWRGISRNFVKTRTPTQVASHAQKYFLRRNNQNRRRRRSSLFDITPDSLLTPTIEEEPAEFHPEPAAALLPMPMPAFPITLAPPAVVLSVLPITGDLNISPVVPVPIAANLIRTVPIMPVPPSSEMADLNLNHKTPVSEQEPEPFLPLSLKLSTSSVDDQTATPSTSTTTTNKHSSTATAFQSMSAGGDSIISVA